MNKEVLYGKTIKRFGQQSQIDKAIEECSELITVLCHARHNRATLDDVAEEIADVEIMCGQLRLICGTDLVTEHERLKLDRLAKIIT